MVIFQRKSGSKDVSLLQPIADLLYVSPDFYTLWNFRREILIALKEELDTFTANNTCDSETQSDQTRSKLDQFNKLCQNELTFIENCLKVNFKSYGTWHHRYWIIGFMNEPNLEREIYLCNQFLQLDERNCELDKTKCCFLINTFLFCSSRLELSTIYREAC